MLQPGRDGPSRDALLGEAWLLLNSALTRYLRYHSVRLGRLSQEDIEDIASEKSLDLLRRAEHGKWRMDGRLESEIAAFISKVARNGLLDALNLDRRRIEPADQTDDAPDRFDRRSGEMGTGSPEVLVERREFARALRGCAGKLEPRSRLVWFFRVFYEMSTKEIADHPEIRLKAGHVDVLLQRSREAIRQCMDRRGFRPLDMPTGVFAELWATFRGPGFAGEVKEP
ncbi:MAG: sigma-70 family RNA polymerase sigma factor [Candidatus Eisenbacteria bacterium]